MRLSCSNWPTPMNSPYLNDLIARVENASGISRDLDWAIWGALQGVTVRETGEYRGRLRWADLEIERFTASLDAALALVERLIPGVWWTIGKGRLRATEPMFGAQLLFGASEVLGAGESNASPAAAVCAALLRALQSKTEGEGL